MPTLQDVGLSLADATGLIEEKITRLKTEQGYAESQGRDAIVRRDQALHEVTTLQSEKSALITEIATLKQESGRIKDGLAEHRANVERSLEQTEAKANVTINQATAATEDAKHQEHAVRQLKAQVAGIKQTLREEAQAAQDAISHAVGQALKALAEIPD